PWPYTTLFRSQEMVRVRLSETLVAIVSQRLLPRKVGHGRVAACEIMIATATIRDALLDPTKTNEIFDLIADGREQYGTQTFDQHLMDHPAEGTVEVVPVQSSATNPTELHPPEHILPRR